jgi:hypothetical protein
VQRTARQLDEFRFSNVAHAVLDKVLRCKFVRCQHASTRPYDLCVVAQIALLAADYDVVCCSAIVRPCNQLLRVQGIAQSERVCTDVAWYNGGFGAAMDQLWCRGL